MTKYPIVHIKWEDHWSDDQSWTDIKKLQKRHKKESVYIIETVGFLLSETDESVMVGLSVASDGMVDGNIVILKKNILSRKEGQISEPYCGTFSLTVPNGVAMALGY